MSKPHGTLNYPKETIDKILACKGKLKIKSIAKITGISYHTVWHILNR